MMTSRAIQEKVFSSPISSHKNTTILINKQKLNKRKLLFKTKMCPSSSRQNLANTVYFPSEEEIIILPQSFTPGPNHVVCARGKGFWDHEGNKKYRALIAQTTSKYEASTNKFEKTLIVSEIVEAIRSANPSGNFVKRDYMCGGERWVEVNDQFAREKVGQSLRDCLHSKYRSSTQSKKSRKRKLENTMNGNLDQVIRSNESVSRQMDEVTRRVHRQGPLVMDDATLFTILSRANSDILETIKRDGSLLTQFQRAASR
jgi:hypothetical protein